MHLNKVNLCWVLSDCRPGHEIQSQTMASHVATSIITHRFILRQPWATMAPRILPGFHSGLRWSSDQPNFSQAPAVIITTGRKAAAVGKYVCQRYRQQQRVVKHIQILDPKDQASNYTWLLLPEHDGRSGDNIVTFTGSIHPYDSAWFARHQSASNPSNWPVAVLVGKPPARYFKHQLSADLQRIRQAHNHQPLLLCGSPRLPRPEQQKITRWAKPEDHVWFTSDDGDNPYQSILLTAQHIYVTADSINMMNECAASGAQVSLLARDAIRSTKHLSFMQSLQDRWTEFGESRQPIKAPSHAAAEVIQDPRFQNWLNSPFSSSVG